MRLILSLLALAANISAADFSACAELDKLRKKSRDATDELNELESAKSNYQSCLDSNRIFNDRSKSGSLGESSYESAKPEAESALRNLPKPCKNALLSNSYQTVFSIVSYTFIKT